MATATLAPPQPASIPSTISSGRPNLASPGRSIRGPLRYQITTSSPQLEAGTKFSIYTRITNPYDVPVRITSVTTMLPIEFIDVVVMENAQRKRKIVELINAVQKSSFSEGKGILRRLFQARSEAPSQRLSAQPVSSAPEVDLISASDPVCLNDLIRSSDEPEVAKATALKQLRQALLEPAGEREVELQPGNSVIHVFTLKTNRSIFFPPNAYQSSVRIEYEIDSSRNVDVADYQLNIRAPLRAVLWGALAGSVFGFMLKDLASQQPVLPNLAYYQHPGQAVTSYLMSLFTAMVIAGIAVVAFARKKDAQPLLTVEDFWGGVFIGFLAGYTGNAYLEKALGAAH